MKNIDEFEIPEDEEDYPITSADEILRQTRRGLAGGECVVYSLYTRPCLYASAEEMEKLLIEITAASTKLVAGHIWSREEFHLHLVEEPREQSGEKLFFLQGCTVYGECIDDEWFIVHVLVELSKQFPSTITQVCDRDGEILLIEAAEYIPKWLKPENARNRVWLWNGKVLLLDDPDGTSAVEGGGLSIAEAAVLLGGDGFKRHQHTAVSNCIQQKVSAFPLQHLAGRHTADVIIPRRCAVILLAYPYLIPVAVNTLCDCDEDFKNDIAGMDCVGASDFVSIPLEFTRLQYAQMMFQNFEAPALLRLAEKRLRLNDKRALKAVDVGFRLTCGLEAAVKRAKRMKLDIRDWKHSYNASCNCTVEGNLEDYVKGVEYRCYATVEGSIDAALSDKSIKIERLHDVVLGATIDDWRGEPDNWLYMTPEAMDQEMTARVNAMKGVIGVGKCESDKRGMADSINTSKEGNI